jgi:hypothetical protein
MISIRRKLPENDVARIFAIIQDLGFPVQAYATVPYLSEKILVEYDIMGDMFVDDKSGIQVIEDVELFEATARDLVNLSIAEDSDMPVGLLGDLYASRVRKEIPNLWMRVDSDALWRMFKACGEME